MSEMLIRILLDGELEDLLPIEVGLQQLDLVLVLGCLLFDGIQFFLRRFRQVLLKVFLYFLPHGFVVVFRGTGVIGAVRVPAGHGKSQQADGH